MQIEKREITKLKQDTQNARTHNKRNLEAIKKSLEAFGQQKPIVVNKSWTVVAGNGTLQAAQELGWEEIQVVQTALNAEQIAAFAIADNRTAELANWDTKILGDLFDDMDMPLRSSIGFSDSEIAKLLGRELPNLNIDDNLDDIEYRVVVLVAGEEQQAELISEMEGRGLSCHPLMS